MTVTVTGRALPVTLSLETSWQAGLTPGPANTLRCAHMSGCSIELEVLLLISYDDIEGEIFDIV